jgi:hypothetical protein
MTRHDEHYFRKLADEADEQSKQDDEARLEAGKQLLAHIKAQRERHSSSPIDRLLNKNED